jgi:hypothetical protein
LKRRTLVPVAVEGIAFWSASLPGWETARAVIRGEVEAPAPTLKRPAPALLAPTERRRAPDTVAVALEVAARACEAAQRPLGEPASVFASTHGDLAISDYMCATLAQTPMLMSPTKFHNSVHNAAAGYWSIGTGSHASYTAISAYNYTFAAGLLETVAQVACDGKPVLYVAFDIESTGALATMAPSRGVLGAGLVIGPHAAGQVSRQRLDCHVESATGVVATRAGSCAADLVAQNALAPCLPFFEALAADAASEVVLALGEDMVMRVRVSPAVDSSPPTAKIRP